MKNKKDDISMERSQTESPRQSVRKYPEMHSKETRSSSKRNPSMTSFLVHSWYPCHHGDRDATLDTFTISELGIRISRRVTLFRCAYL
jgi:hypothetical protein